MTLYKEIGDSKMKKRIYLFGIAVGSILVVLCGCSNSTNQDNEQSQSTNTSLTSQQSIDVSNIYQGYCKDYKQNDVSEGKQITVTAPDFEKIMQSIYDNGTPSNIDSTALESKIKEYPEMTKDYTFIVENDNQEQIEKQFYDMVMYDIIMTAYKNIDYSIEEED